MTRDECMLWLREQIERESPGWKVLCGGCGQVTGPDPRLPILLQVMLETLETHEMAPHTWDSYGGTDMLCKECEAVDQCPEAVRVIAAVEQIHRETHRGDPAGVPENPRHLSLLGVSCGQHADER